MSASTVSEHSSARQWGILWHKLNNSLPSPPYLWLSSTVKYWKMSKNDPKLPNVWLSRLQWCQLGRSKIRLCSVPSVNYLSVTAMGKIQV